MADETPKTEKATPTIGTPPSGFYLNLQRWDRQKKAWKVKEILGQIPRLDIAVATKKRPWLTTILKDSELRENFKTFLLWPIRNVSPNLVVWAKANDRFNPQTQQWEISPNRPPLPDWFMPVCDGLPVTGEQSLAALSRFETFLYVLLEEIEA